jgi:signal transduction histidine kinase
MFFLADRLYTAVPVYAGGKSGSAIIGAVALSSPQRSERTGAFRFLGDVNTAVLISSIGVALLAALAATIFSRRLTRPLARLEQAALHMAGGDYAVRVGIPSPGEYHQLAESFNTMAAALERDVAELRTQEQLRRELVADVAHELATPLTAIEGFTEALLDGTAHDPATREETARTIAREAGRLHRLVDQLRRVTLYESGARPLERAPIRLASLIEETLAVLTPEIEQREITVEQAIPADLPPALADSDGVTEILLNILENALHHTPRGGRIDVSAVVEQDAGHAMVRISIADSGPGIPADERERVFERFHRTDRSRDASTGGSGLGLAIVKALALAHGGRVSVDERPGGGARFSFTLPAI